jgi:hypothetical protein
MNHDPGQGWLSALLLFKPQILEDKMPSFICIKETVYMGRQVKPGAHIHLNDKKAEILKGNSCWELVASVKKDLPPDDDEAKRLELFEQAVALGYSPKPNTGAKKLQIMVDKGKADSII